MKLADLIHELKKLAKENNLGASHDVMVYDKSNTNGNWHEIDIKINQGDLSIEIKVEE